MNLRSYLDPDRCITCRRAIIQPDFQGDEARLRAKGLQTCPVSRCRNFLRQRPVQP